MHRLVSISILVSFTTLTSMPLAGCRDGYANTSGADLRAFGLQSPTSALDASGEHTPQPQARFPATIAVVRVQAQDYHRRGMHAYAAGGYSIVTTRDVETDDRFKSFASHPMIRALVPLNHLALPAHIRGAADLREAARRVNADMLLIYTLDSSSEVVHHVPELAVVTLGLMPEGESQGRCTASGILLDARSGYTYALSEASSSQKRLTSAWGSDSAERKAINTAEQRAFHELLEDLSIRWREVADQYAMR
jgi:hypothetical protein